MELPKKNASMRSERNLWLFLLVWLAAASICTAQRKRVLCNYANWSESRNQSYRLFPRNIDTDLCTHVVYVFAMPDLSEGVVPLDFLNTLNDDRDNEFVALKARQPDLTLMLSIGGWNEGSIDFSLIAADPAAVSWITRVLHQKIKNVGFDGLDLNWQWPVPGLREGSNSADRENFAKWIKITRDYFDEEARRTNTKPLLLSVVLPPFRSYIERGFDMNATVGLVDFVNLHTMDFHTSTDPQVDHHAPLFGSNDESTVDSAVKMLLSYNIEPSKINLGVPFYGHSYKLQDAEETDIKSPSDDEGEPGFGTNIRGQLAYFEICRYVMDKRLRVVHANETALGPYAVNNESMWVSYDDAEAVRRKVEYAMNMGLGGITLWTIDMDDFNGICRGRFPLTNMVRDTIRNARASAPVTVSNQVAGLDTSVIQAANGGLDGDRIETNLINNEDNSVGRIDTDFLNNQDGTTAPDTNPISVNGVGQADNFSNPPTPVVPNSNSQRVNSITPSTDFSTVPTLFLGPSTRPLPTLPPPPPPSRIPRPQPPVAPQVPVLPQTPYILRSPTGNYPSLKAQGNIVMRKVNFSYNINSYDLNNFQ